MRWLVCNGNSRRILLRWPLFILHFAADFPNANTMAPPTRPLASSSSAITTTLTLGNPSPARILQQQRPTALVLRLNPRKKVTWKEGTVDNEFLQRKSSKKCCIFHKEKSFDEDDSDEEDLHHHDHGCRRPDGGDHSGGTGSSGSHDL